MNYITFLFFYFIFKICGVFHTCRMSHFYKPHFKGAVATLEVVATLLSSGDLKIFF